MGKAITNCWKDWTYGRNRREGRSRRGRNRKYLSVPVYRCTQSKVPSWKYDGRVVRRGHKTYNHEVGLRGDRVTKIPILGLGGIESPADVAEYMLQELRQLRLARRISWTRERQKRLVGDFEMWCRDENTFEINRLRGSLKA